MPNIGPVELIIILVIALLILGPGRLPDVGLRPRQEHPRVPQGGHATSRTRSSSTPPPATPAPAAAARRRRPRPLSAPRRRAPAPNTLPTLPASMPAARLSPRPRARRHARRARPSPRRAPPAPEPVVPAAPSCRVHAAGRRDPACPARAAAWPTPTSRTTARPRSCPSRQPAATRRHRSPASHAAGGRRRRDAALRPPRRAAAANRDRPPRRRRSGRSSGFVFGQQIIEVLKAPYGDAPLLLLAPGEGFFIILKIAIATGIVLGMPVILFELWRFVSPGAHGGGAPDRPPVGPARARLLRRRRRRRLLRPAVRHRLPVELRDRRPAARERLDRRRLLRVRGHDVRRVRARDGVPDRARPALEGRDRDERAPQVLAALRGHRLRGRRRRGDARR